MQALKISSSSVAAAFSARRSAQRAPAKAWAGFLKIVPKPDLLPPGEWIAGEWGKYQAPFPASGSASGRL